MCGPALELAEEPGERQSVAVRDPRQRLPERGDRARTGGEQQRVVGKLPAALDPRRSRVGIDGSDGVADQPGVGDRRSVGDGEPARAAQPERLGDAGRVEDQLLSRLDQV